jgi:signal transduction histidine kinase
VALLDTGLGHFLLLMLVIAPVLAAVLGLLYHQELQTLERAASPATVQAAAARSGHLAQGLSGPAADRRHRGLVAGAGPQEPAVAQEESNRQTGLLVRRSPCTSRPMPTAGRPQAGRSARQPSRARSRRPGQPGQSRYISAISHELRTPLNSILGYAQLMGADASVPPHRQHAVQVIRRGGEHLLSLIEGTLDIARIESGKLALQVAPMRFAEGMQSLAGLFELQAQPRAWISTTTCKAACRRWCGPMKSACARS